jgi:hypothetical protein
MDGPVFDSAGRSSAPFWRYPVGLTSRRAIGYTPALIEAMEKLRRDQPEREGLEIRHTNGSRLGPWSGWVNRLESHQILTGAKLDAFAGTRMARPLRGSAPAQGWAGPSHP